MRSCRFPVRRGARMTVSTFQMYIHSTFNSLTCYRSKNDSVHCICISIVQSKMKKACMGKEPAYDGESLIKSNRSSVIAVVGQRQHHNRAHAVCTALQGRDFTSLRLPSMRCRVVQPRTRRAGCKLENRYMSWRERQLWKNLSSTQALQQKFTFDAYQLL